MRELFLGIVAVSLLLPASAQGPAGSLSGTTASGATWVADVPEPWNGTVLLWSHGYSARQGPAENGPRELRAELLKRGYALLGSSYSKAGWAVAEAVPDQIEILDAFESAYGKPARTIAWGASMGGLVSVALVERHAERFSAALPLCSSIGGAIGMMNMGLDGAFAFKTLLAPDSPVRVVGIEDDFANARAVSAALDVAQQSPQGRARIALAGVLAGLPPWTDAGATAPAPNDYAAQQQQIAKAFVMGTFLPRSEQERRAGGVFSWNTGIDYEEQLRSSGRHRFVAALYREAGLDLASDLARLNAAQRITADASAVDYMMRNYTPSGVIDMPVLALQAIGDGVTSPSLQQAYAQTVRAARRSRWLALAWSNRAGHCTSTPAEMIAALKALEHRLDTGRWQVDAATLNRLGRESGLGEAKFVAHRAAPMLRPCRQSERCLAPVEHPPAQPVE